MIRKFGNPGSETGSLVLAMAFILSASMIVTIVLAAAVGMTTNSRNAALQQDDRFLLQEVTHDIVEGDSSDAQLTLKTSGRYCKNVSLPSEVSGKGRFCTTFERADGEDPYAGARVDVSITRSKTTRYYTAHFSGFYDRTNSSYLFNRNTNINAADLEGRSRGFSSAEQVSVGLNSSLITYTPRTGKPINGVRLNSANVVLDSPNEGFTGLWRQYGGGADGAQRLPGGTCQGAGCAASTLVNIPSGQRDVIDPSLLPACAPTRDESTQSSEVWRASAQPTTTLAVPPEGMCLSGMVFDRTTTINNPTSAPILLGSGGLQVEPNVKVNMNHSIYPDPDNLRIIMPQSPVNGGKAKYNFDANIYISPGAKFAGVVTRESVGIGNGSRATCVVRGTFYGSLLCGGAQLDASEGNLYWPREYADATNITDVPDSAFRYIWVPNWLSVNYTRTSQSGAGF